MADRSLRGMRLGAQSLQSEEGVTFSPRTEYRYRCTVCEKVSEVTFSAEAEAPHTWECRICGEEAILLDGADPVVLDRPEAKVPRSHWDMLLERRSREELEELLEERLTFLRSRRGTLKAAQGSSSTEAGKNSQRAKTTTAAKPATKPAEKKPATKKPAAKKSAAKKPATNA